MLPYEVYNDLQQVHETEKKPIKGEVKKNSNAQVAASIYKMIYRHYAQM
jgi:hypothetical protein